jgi:hypothetical protein
VYPVVLNEGSSGSALEFEKFIKIEPETPDDINSSEPRMLEGSKLADDLNIETELIS